MSPEEVTIIDRDGWDPIGSKNPTEEEKLAAKNAIESFYDELYRMAHSLLFKI